MEQPGLEESVSVHGKGWNKVSFKVPPTQTIPGFWDKFTLAPEQEPPHWDQNSPQFKRFQTQPLQTIIPSQSPLGAAQHQHLNQIPSTSAWLSLHSHRNGCDWPKPGLGSGIDIAKLLFAEGCEELSATRPSGCFHCQDEIQISFPCSHPRVYCKLWRSYKALAAVSRADPGII